MSFEATSRRQTIDFVNHIGRSILVALVLLMGLAVFTSKVEASGSVSSPIPAAVPSAAASTTRAEANSVVAWLTGAEIQAETDAQRAELRRALQDMLSLRPAELRARRYAGFDGTPAARSLPELLTGHLVPRTPQALDAARFYEDNNTPAAQRAVRRLLSQMKQ